MSTTRSGCLAITLLATLTTFPAAAGDAAEVETVLANAASSLEAARQSGNAWTATAGLMAEARSALAAGRLEEAGELARRALLTADMAQQQTRDEVDAWQARVPKR